MGRGACFEFADASIGFIRSVFACACCCLCAGPILLIVGVVMLTSKNDYATHVTQYNAAVKKFDTEGSKANIRASNGTLASSVTIQQLTSAGTTSPLSSGGFSGTLPTTGDNVDPNGLSFPLRTITKYSISGGNKVSVTDSTGKTYNLTLPTPVTVAKSKSSLRCSSYEQRNYKRCSELCQEAAPSGCSTYTTYSSSTETCTRSRDYCRGTCRWTERQTSYCTTLAWSAAAGFASAAQQSCLYPFGADDQPTGGCAPVSSQYVFVMSSSDPFIQLQKILGERSFSFGLTAAQQRNAGLALVAVGAVITAAVIGLMVMLKKAMSKDEKSTASVYGAFGRAPPPMQYQQPANVQFQQSPYQAAPPMMQQQQQQPPMQQPYMQPVQPQMAPPMQQQPAYGQPMPGQVAPGYGQPGMQQQQPMYGQQPMM